MHCKLYTQQTPLPPPAPGELQLLQVPGRPCCTRAGILHVQLTHARAPRSGTRPRTNTPVAVRTRWVSQKKDSGPLRLRGEKRAPQNTGGACGLCRPSVPKGIKQACQAEYKGGGKLTAKLRKASKNSAHSRQFFFFFPPRGVKYQVSSKFATRS